MANNAAQYRFFVGYTFSELPAEEQDEVECAIREGYLRIEEGSGIIREVSRVGESCVEATE